VSDNRPGVLKENRCLTCKLGSPRAQQDVNALAERPNDDILLKLNALYKQAAQDDATGERPGSFDFVRRAKFDAWSAIKGTTRPDSMQQSIALVDSLRR
jgi:diazepam-binding inhibitor (GABA receptor modulating acyl-CoA-binding protein)